jgi:hypothetical protein
MGMLPRPSRDVRDRGQAGLWPGLRLKPGDGDRNQALNRGIRWQAGGSVEGVQAVACQFGGLDIVTDMAGSRGLGQ